MVGLARRNERIEALKEELAHCKGKLYAFKTDVAHEDQILAAFKWTTANVGPVHILVNNAGIHIRTRLTESETEPWMKMIKVNMLAVFIATREAIKIMEEHNIDGHVININSILGHNLIASMDYDVYPSTKFGITAYTESLRLELMKKKSKIRVTVSICTIIIILLI